MSSKFNNKKMGYIFTAILLVVLILVVIKSNSYFYKVTSPNTNNIILIRQSSPFSFGSTPIKIIAKKQGITGLFKHYKYKTTIGNDGKLLKEENINISWGDDNNALITLTGEEQLPETIIVEFDDIIRFK